MIGYKLPVWAAINPNWAPHNIKQTRRGLDQFLGWNYCTSATTWWQIFVIYNICWNEM